MGGRDRDPLSTVLLLVAIALLLFLIGLVITPLGDVLLDHRRPEPVLPESVPVPGPGG